MASMKKKVDPMGSMEKRLTVDGLSMEKKVDHGND